MSSTTLPSASTPLSVVRRGSGRLALLVTAAVSSLSLLTAWPLALMAVPQAGPWCRQAQCLDYPYTSAEYRPIDFAWMYPALLGLVAFALLILLLESRGHDRPTVARLARVTAQFGVGLLVVDYAVQLMAVQPSIIRGEQSALSFWTQYNPHGAFIALENLGYLLLSIALLGVAVMVPGAGARPRSVRIVAGVLGGTGIVLLPVMGALLGSRLDYFYEVGVISTVWVAIIVVAPLLVLSWRNAEVPVRASAERTQR